MARAGVNLRRDDISEYVAACATAGIAPGALPVLFTLTDDNEETAGNCMAVAAQEQLDVAIIRFYSYDRRYYSVVPPNGQVIGWNERGNNDPNENLPDWVNPWWQAWRQARPDAKLHYGAPNVDGYWRENAPLEAELDFVDRHIGSTFSPPAPRIQGKPAVVTEIDVDRDRYATISDPGCIEEVLACVERCLQRGLDNYVWGIDWFKPDASVDPRILAGLVKLNQRYAGATPVTPDPGPEPVQQPAEPTTSTESRLADLEQRVSVIEQREALSVDAMVKEIANRLTSQPPSAEVGPGSPAADVDAIAGGQSVVEQQAAQEPPANPQ